MITSARSVHLPEFIDEGCASAIQYWVIVLCGLVMFTDGFDTQAISYMAPYIAKDWGLARAALGPIFSAALVGLMIGYLALSPLAERFGHRRVIITSTISFGLFTLLGVFAQTLEQLIAARILTGIGLGAAAPSAVALTSAFSPKRLRATFVLLIYCGFAFGFVMAGVAAGQLIPRFGWRALFVVGAVVPLLLTPLLFGLPETILRMGRKGGGGAHALWLEQPEGAAGLGVTAPEGARTSPKAVLRALFAKGMAGGTSVLWVTMSINLGVSYALQSWLPTILTDLHYPLSAVAAATTLTMVGGIVAAIVLGPFMDRLGSFRVLGTFCIAGSLFVGAIGAAMHSSLSVLMIVNFLAGCCVSGGQKGLIALIASFYPPSLRAAGVGLALGVGRVGGILGPLLFGALSYGGRAPGGAFLATAGAVLISGGLVLWLGALHRRRTALGEA